MNLDDTIVAIATPSGRGGIGVVRISGPESKQIAGVMLRHKRELEPGRAVFAELIDPETSERIDEVVVTHFARPHSYTNDDVVEISAHGSPVVLRHVVELALARGARMAQPGEFTMRAFLNGRIDLTQAEAVRDLIESQTLYQAKVAAQQLEGALSKRLQPIKKKLVELIAIMEAGIDFAEDDVSVLPAKDRLVERERAIVTATPGTTRDLVTETVALGGIPLKLIDTAGIRHSTDEAESIGIRKSYEALSEADLVLVVVDSSSALTKDDHDLIEASRARRALVIANKSDLAASHAVSTDSVEVFKTSALTGEGIDQLRDEILNQVAGTSGAEHEAGFLTNVRQQRLVDETLNSLAAASEATKHKVPHEMIMLDLYGALRPLDAITGETTTDDILNLIFSSFCIGK